MPLDLRAFFFVESKAMQKRVYNNTFRCHPFLQGKEAQSFCLESAKSKKIVDLTSGETTR